MTAFQFEFTRGYEMLHMKWISWGGRIEEKYFWSLVQFQGNIGHWPKIANVALIFVLEIIVAIYAYYLTCSSGHM